MLLVVVAGTHSVDISVNYQAGNVSASVGKCRSICGEVFAYLVELKIPRSQACPVGHCIDGFVEGLLSKNYWHPLCRTPHSSCTESDNDGVMDVASSSPSEN